MMAATFDVAQRLAEGEQALAVLDDYVAACRALGLPSAASLPDLYRAESGLDLAALTADARSLDAAALADAGVVSDAPNTGTSVASSSPARAWRPSWSCARGASSWRRRSRATAPPSRPRGGRRTTGNRPVAVQRSPYTPSLRAGARHRDTVLPPRCQRDHC